MFQPVWADAWCGALMNLWNRDFVHANYPRQVADFLVEGPDGTLSVPVGRSHYPNNVPAERIPSELRDLLLA